jgi:glycosyltransferase involved in cell wall biosynthesis
MSINQKFLTQVTPVILSFNEAPNIARILAKLQWAKEVVVVDSGSTDQTVEILDTFSNVRCVHRPFDSHANQWNFAIKDTSISTEWVLALDADYLLSDSLVAEMDALNPLNNVDGYETAFLYCIFGKPLRGTLYPPVTTLYRLRGARYVQDGHTQRIKILGAVQRLSGRIWHDDRKPLSRWLASQVKYADQEAALLLSKPVSELRIQDRLRRLMVITPWLVPLYCMTVGRGALDGWAGIYYALERGVAEAVLALKLLEARLAARKDQSPNE